MSAALVDGFAARALGQVLEPYEYEAPSLSGREVRVDVSHCGLCYTDIQGISDHYGICDFPFVPGHEVVGYVTELGSAVSMLKVGDRVGIGWQGRSCGKCEWCLKGEVQFCVDIDLCGVWRPYGGFSTSLVVDERFAYPLPSGMPSETAAVLMCAGIAVYNPISRHAPSGDKKVAVIGLGGLGHMAIEFAHAFGNEVTAISSSPSKQELALSLGADHFILISDREAMRRVRYSFDVLLYTSHAITDWTALVNSVCTNGSLVVVGFSDVPISFDPMELVVHQSSMTGSFLANHETMRGMLAFAQDHAIRPAVELMPMDQVNTAIQRLKDEHPLQRFVLVN